MPGRRACSSGTERATERLTRVVPRDCTSLPADRLRQTLATDPPRHFAPNLGFDHRFPLRVLRPSGTASRPSLRRSVALSTSPNAKSEASGLSNRGARVVSSPCASKHTSPSGSCLHSSVLPRRHKSPSSKDLAATPASWRRGRRARPTPSATSTGCPCRAIRAIHLAHSTISDGASTTSIRSWSRRSRRGRRRKSCSRSTCRFPSWLA